MRVVDIQHAKRWGVSEHKPGRYEGNDKHYELMYYGLTWGEALQTAIDHEVNVGNEAIVVETATGARLWKLQRSG